MINTDGIAKMILNNSQWVIKEIEQQPQKWLETFDIIKKHRKELEEFLDPNYDVIFTGAGTSEYIGSTITRELNLSGERNFSTIGSPDIVTHPHFYYKKNKSTILVSFARSGNSPESLGAIQHADKLIDNVKHLFITCNPESEMIKYANKNSEKVFILMMPEGTYDQSFAMTSSFTCMVLAGYLSFNLGRLNEFEKYIQSASKLGGNILENESSNLKDFVGISAFQKFNLLGSGNFKSLAQEAAIKILEISGGRPAVWHDSVPGFRHGPAVTLRSGKETLNIIFYENNEYANQYADDMLMEIREWSQSYNRILAITPRHTQATVEYADYEVFLDDKDLPSIFLVLPFSIVIHLIMLYRGWDYGLDSDNPFGKGAVRGIRTKIYSI